MAYQSDLLLTQPWRLLTAHVVHVGWVHLVLNLSGLLLLPVIFPCFPNRRFGVIGGFSAVLLSLIFWRTLPDLYVYVGLSGVLHGWYFAAAWHALEIQQDRLIAVILLFGLTLKLAYEVFFVGQASAAWIGAPVLTQAHLFGVLIALGLSVVLTVISPSCVSQSQFSPPNN
ncbi:MAG: rhombosortase [Pseudomonadota bacterium]|nr:rhombosortase [Pseudomonadota bacterium]